MISPNLIHSIGNQGCQISQALEESTEAACYQCAVWKPASIMAWRCISPLILNDLVCTCFEGTYGATQAFSMKLLFLLVTKPNHSLPLYLKICFKSNLIPCVSLYYLHSNVGFKWSKSVYIVFLFTCHTVFDLFTTSACDFNISSVDNRHHFISHFTSDSLASYNITVTTFNGAGSMLRGDCTTSSLLHGLLLLDAGGGYSALEQSCVCQHQWGPQDEALLHDWLG